MRAGGFVMVIAAGVLLSCGRGPADTAAAPDPVPALVDQLHKGSTTAGAAIRRLVGLGEFAVPELSRVAAESQDTLQRVQAVLTLGEIGPKAESALPVLRRIIDERVPHLSECAEEASDRIRATPPESKTYATWDEWWKANRVKSPDTPAMR